MIKVSPLTQKKIRHFKEIKRGYWSFVILSIMLILSLFAELLINSKALMVKYDGSYYFPVVSDVRLGSEFGQDSSSEADYRVLQQVFEEEGGGQLCYSTYRSLEPIRTRLQWRFPSDRAKR